MGKLSNQSAANGWTDELIVDFNDFSVANAGTLADNATYIVSYSVPAGTHLRNISANLTTAFDDSGSGDELNVSAGLTGGDVDGYLASAAIHVDMTEITTVVNTGALLDNENAVHFASADTIDFLFTPNASTGTNYSLNELNAGSISFKFDIAQI
tara:strand:+ start:281 stop:745 length:465 start_codon:yes stop_codon:yes gene_type:complete